MKKHKHLPIFGVGPIYVFIIAVLTFAPYLMRNLPALSSGRIDVLQKPLLILGIVLIVLGVFIWFQGAIVSRLLDGIVQNRLVTTGIYAWVRNPLYTAFMFACNGVILMAGNLWFFFLPFVFWGLIPRTTIPCPIPFSVRHAPSSTGTARRNALPGSGTSRT